MVVLYTEADHMNASLIASMRPFCAYISMIKKQNVLTTGIVPI